MSLPASIAEELKPDFELIDLAPFGLTYLDRKALSAAGQWGRVKEMPNGCWEWQGSRTGGGYGGVGIRKNYHAVHRLICEIFNGPLRRNEDACHSCNNRACCNPRHITPGSPADNSHDYLERSGRGRPPALTRESIEEAARLYASGGWSLNQIGAKFGVSGTAIRRRIGHVTRPDMLPWYKKLSPSTP